MLSTEGLRIAFYLPDLSGGGVERMRLALRRELMRAGADVRLFLHAARGELLREAQPPPTVFGTRRTLADLLPLWRALRAFRPHVLLSSLNHSNVVAALAGSGARVPATIITQHNALSAEAGPGAPLAYRVMPAAYRVIAPLVHGIVAVSAGVADDMARCTGIARDRFTVIANPVIDETFACRAAAALEHPWFAPGMPPVFVTAGRLVLQKDHATLLAAFARYRAGAEARLMILGEGPLRPALAAQARALGIAVDVALPGFVENPLPYFREAAAFVLSSRHEGFGNVLVEAMGCGLPVIATDCPHGPAEILSDGLHGRLVPPGDPVALAAALAPDLRRQFPPGQVRARAAQFGSGRAAQAYLALMQAALARRARVGGGATAFQAGV